MKKLRQLLPSLLSLTVFTSVIYYIPPPTSLGQANFIHWAVFFTPIIFFCYLSSLLFTKNPKISLIITLFLPTALALQGLRQLNILTLGVLLLTIGALLFLTKSKSTRYRFPSRIPKLSRLEKQ